MFYEPSDELEIADGRIRSPEDVPVRLLGALEAACRDERLSELDRRVHSVYCERALEIGWVTIMAGDAWVCERLGLDEGAWRSRVWRSRQRLQELGYAKRLRVEEVRHWGLRRQVAARKAAGKRPVTLLEVCKAPALPVCDHCGGPIPDIEHVSKRFCSDACRAAGWRVEPRLKAALEEALGEPLV
jgi:hypothetical protein